MVDCDRTDLICLHLAAYDATESPVPPAVTAAGIGDALELGDTAVSRVSLLEDLDTMHGQGLVTVSERPVEGYDSPRTVYALTEEGNDRARDVRRRVREESVVVAGGTSEEIPLADIDRYFEGETPLVTALARLTEDDEVQLDRYTGDGFVDRDEELAAVTDAIETSISVENRTVLVSGAAGTGKTALAREALDQVRDDHEEVVVATGASPEGATDPYAAFRQAFDSLPNGDTLRTQLTDAIPAVSPDDPENVRARRTALFEEVADSLRSIAAERPIVLFLENLQWADEATLALFAHLATSIDELIHPVAFVGTYREPAVAVSEDTALVDVVERIERDGSLTEVTLGPLSWTATRALLTTVVGSERLPEAFVDLVYEQTGGNPLFVRETAIHLLETGGVDPQAGSYPTSSETVALPQEVTDQIDRRLANLDAESRELLRLGAVLGERIPEDVLATASDLSAATRREYTDVLIASHIWERVDRTRGIGIDGAASRRSEGSGDLQFVSGGVREAVVDRLPDAEAGEYHRQVAEAFVRVEDEDEQAARIAYQYEQAGAYEEAIASYRQAGDRAREAYAHEDAIENYVRALTLARKHGVVDDATLAAIHADIADVYDAIGEYDDAREIAKQGRDVAPEQSRERCRLLGRLAESQFEQGEYQQARENAREQRELAATIDDREPQAESIRRIGLTHSRQGAYDNAREAFQQSLSIAQAHEYRRCAAKVHKDLGVVAYFQGEYDRADEAATRALDIARELDDRQLEGKCLNNLGLNAQARGEYDQAREYHERSLAIKRDLGSRHGEAITLGNLGMIAQMQGEYDKAREYHEQSLQRKRELGDQRGEGITLGNLGVIAGFQGAYEEAREYHEQSLELARELGDRHGESRSLDNLGAITRTQGAYEEAREYHEQSLTIRRELDNPHGEAQSLNNLGRIALAQREFDEARNYYEAVLDIARELDLRQEAVLCLQGLGSIARETGAFEQSRTYFEDALDRLGADGHSHPRAELLLERGLLALAVDEIDAAREYAARARQTFERIGASHQRGRSRLLLGRIDAADDAPAAAREHWRAALASFESVDTPQDVLATLEQLVRVCREQGDEQRASEWCQQAQSVLADAPDATAELHREWVERAASELGVV
jgi:predicted ATPase/DNA-binding PadR family transcriptional regulator